MSTLKSSAENLTLNADGSNNDIIFQSNGSNIATLDQAGLLTATTFAGSGASLTALPAANITGTLPAISGANLTGLTSSQMPAGSVIQWAGTSGIISGHESTTSTTPATSAHTTAAITIKGGTSSKVVILVYSGAQINNGDGIGVSWIQRAISGGATTQINENSSYINGNNFATATQVYVDTPNVAADTVVTYSGRYMRESGSSTFYYLHNTFGYGISIMEIAQ